MNAKYFYFLPVLILSLQTGWAAPQPYSNARPTPGDDLNGLVRQFRTALADLKHEVRNHETEIRVFEERLHNQESTLEQLRQELTEDVQSQRDFARASNINLEGKTETLDQS